MRFNLRVEHAFWLATKLSILFASEEGLIGSQQLQFVPSELHLTSEAYTTQSHAHTKFQKYTDGLDALSLEVAVSPKSRNTKSYQTRNARKLGSVLSYTELRDNLCKEIRRLQQQNNERKASAAWG
jgi:hypothetical protein